MARLAPDAASVIVTVSLQPSALTVLAVLASPLINQIFALPLEGAAKQQQLELWRRPAGTAVAPDPSFYGDHPVTAPLHARRRFAAPAFAPVLTNWSPPQRAWAWWLVSSGNHR
ncbi:MAG: hypothetical protein R2789_06800 [Microthrixaceae bacterium]